MKNLIKHFLKKQWTIIAAMSLFCCAVQGICEPGSLKSLKNLSLLPLMPSVSIWQKFCSIKPGMTAEQAMNSGPFVPMISAHGNRPGWCTLEYTGKLTTAEAKAFQGKVIAIDVQFANKPGPISVTNPPGGCLNPSSGGTIATISSPYLSDGGAVCLD